MSTDKDRQIEEENQIMRKKNINYIQQENPNIIQNPPQINDDSNMNIEGIQNQYQQPHNQQEEQQYEDYGDYDEYGEYMMDESMNTYERRISSENNAQYQMEDLLKIIEKEVEKVMELSGFSKEWALVYFETCGWKIDLVTKFIDQKKTNLQMIHYSPLTASITDQNGICMICCFQNQLIFRNSCGDEFCEDCWKQQLIQRMKSFNKDPFPPCINEDCQVRISPFISEQLSKNDSNFKKLYHKTLCRSYATGSTSVKMCKGREKFSCDRCFKVNKIFDILECQTCGNIVCARCGQEYHVPSQCFQGPNWRKIVEQSTNFIQTLNYRICPYCKQAVQRSSGCNSLVCKCKQMFCYICGQKWLPNHNQHGFCYRQKQIKALEYEKKKKAENEKQYIDKLQNFKSQIQTYVTKMKKIDDLELQSMRKRLICDFKIISNQLDYLEPLKKRLQIALLIGKNYVLSLYFRQSQVMRAELTNLRQPIQNAYEFLIQKVPVIIQAFGDKQKTVFSKRATQMRDKKISPQQQLAKSKIEMYSYMKVFQKYMMN